MKKISLLGIFFIYTFSFGNEYCENFKIVSIFDFPPTPQTPGGNYFLLLLTVNEDNPDNLTNYANLFFVNEFGDTISIPTGANSHLPIYTTDTIPYLLKLNSTINNQDFPKSFNGKLIIINPNKPQCAVIFSNNASSAESIESNNIIKISPNPFVEFIQITSKKQIEKILIFNSIGEKVNKYYPKFNTIKLNLLNLKIGVYFVIIQLKNGELLQRKILKLNN